ncbi:uncharacterized protein LOC113208892 isoform X2 [Frankliniella occidentalis]|uniref:Uncharacterized protein LOC113208892 isoform X2 n=1 Tax=Frankliniella occidentalis TaxID=133901 RepID=A0A6J1SME5_FRAOC|nr:uncharacterized protein LOC113208892 isoform X2 [Frankliniella occidentalis]
MSVTPTPSDDGDDFDLYADLEEENCHTANTKQQNEECEAMKMKLQKLQSDLEQLRSHNEKLIAENLSISCNISVLYKTAAAEVKRKDTKIAELYRELDNLAFRRTAKKRNVSQPTVSERNMPSANEGNKCTPMTDDVSKPDIQQSRTSSVSGRDVSHQIDVGLPSSTNFSNNLVLDKALAQECSLLREKQSQTSNENKTQSPIKTIPKKRKIPEFSILSEEKPPVNKESVVPPKNKEKDKIQEVKAPLKKSVFERLGTKDQCKIEDKEIVPENKTSEPRLNCISGIPSIREMGATLSKLLKNDNRQEPSTASHISQSPDAMKPKINSHFSSGAYQSANSENCTVPKSSLLGNSPSKILASSMSESLKSSINLNSPVEVAIVPPPIEKNVHGLHHLKTSVPDQSQSCSVNVECDSTSQKIVLQGLSERVEPSTQPSVDLPALPSEKEDFADKISSTGQICFQPPLPNEAPKPLPPLPLTSPPPTPMKNQSTHCVSKGKEDVFLLKNVDNQPLNLTKSCQGDTAKGTEDVFPLKKGDNRPLNLTRNSRGDTAKDTEDAFLLKKVDSQPNLNIIKNSQEETAKGSEDVLLLKKVDSQPNLNIIKNSQEETAKGSEDVLLLKKVDSQPNLNLSKNSQGEIPTLKQLSENINKPCWSNENLFIQCPFKPRRRAKSVVLHLVDPTDTGSPSHCIAKQEVNMKNTASSIGSKMPDHKFKKTPLKKTDSYENRLSVESRSYHYQRSVYSSRHLSSVKSFSHLPERRSPSELLSGRSGRIERLSHQDKIRIRLRDRRSRSLSPQRRRTKQDGYRTRNAQSSEFIRRSSRRVQEMKNERYQEQKKTKSATINSKRPNGNEKEKQNTKSKSYSQRMADLFGESSPEPEEKPSRHSGEKSKIHDEAITTVQPSCSKNHSPFISTKCSPENKSSEKDATNPKTTTEESVVVIRHRRKPRSLMNLSNSDGSSVTPTDNSSKSPSCPAQASTNTFAFCSEKTINLPNNTQKQSNCLLSKEYVARPLYFSERESRKRRFSDDSLLDCEFSGDSEESSMRTDSDDSYLPHKSPRKATKQRSVKRMR